MTDFKNRKIRVLRIIGECKTGGTETIALNYYRNLNHDDIAMDFLFYGDSIPRFNKVLEANGDKVINVVEYSKNLLGSIWQIRDAVKKGDYDIVHAQLNTLNMFPLLGAYLGGAKIRIAANHSTANLKYELKKTLLKYILRPTTRIFATHYAACSYYAGAWCFGQKKVNEGTVKVINNAIDLAGFHFSEQIRADVRKKEGWEGRFVIGHAGRFVEQKNHRFIVEIFAEVYKKLPNALLVFAGDGELMNEIRTKVHNLGLDDNVQFLGVRFDMDNLMQGMDLFLFPSLYEGLGNVITEAQAVGLQSIVSDVVPNEVKMTEYVDFLPLNTPCYLWADRVLEYKDGYVRRNTHDDLVENGYEIVSAAHNLEDYYKELCNKY